MWPIPALQISILVTFWHSPRSKVAGVGSRPSRNGWQVHIAVIQQSACVMARKISGSENLVTKMMWYFHRAWHLLTYLFLAFTDPRYVLHNLIKDNAWCGRIHRGLWKRNSISFHIWNHALVTWSTMNTICYGNIADAQCAMLGNRKRGDSCDAMGWVAEATAQGCGRPTCCTAPYAPWFEGTV